MFCALVFFERKARTRGASVAAFFAGAACFFAVELGWCKYFVEAIDPSYPCFLFYVPEPARRPPTGAWAPQSRGDNNRKRWLVAVFTK